MEKIDFLGDELRQIGIEATKAMLIGKTVFLSVDGKDGHSDSYIVDDVQPALCNPEIAVILLPRGHNFLVPVGMRMRVTISTEGG